MKDENGFDKFEICLYDIISGKKLVKFFKWNFAIRQAYISDLKVMSTTQIQKVFAKVRLTAPKSDFAFWQAQPYQARLAALEKIRQEYHAWKYDVEPRLQRVYTIVKR